MGSGIAQSAAQNGFNVTIVDMNDQLLNNSKNIIEQSLKRIGKATFKEDAAAVEKFYSDSISKIKFEKDSVAGVKDADLVIEAIIENLDKKQELFSLLDKKADKSTIFASNTSSLSITKISEATQRKDRFGGLHFFNPVPIMKLVEVVKTEFTSQSTLDSLVDFGKRIHKTTIVCKDTPGFVVNRLLVPYLNEAINLYARGVASPSDIDHAMKLGAGHPMGPFELLDYVGLDTSYYILEGWSKQYPDEPSFKPSEQLKQLIKEKKFGKKSGEGFYKYEKPHHQHQPHHKK